MSDTPPVVEQAMRQLVERLACPRCHGVLGDHGDHLRCEPCRRDYPLRDGVARMNVDDEDGDGNDVLERHLRQEQAASESRRRMRRLREELHAVTDALCALPGSATLLALGCRGGRFSSPMQSATRLLIEADVHGAVVRHAVDRAMNPPRVAALACTPERLPFADDALDGAVCVRASHRIEGDRRREETLHELLRVASRFVLFSFNDTLSLPNLSRRLRRRAPHAGTMRHARVSEIAAAHGARVARGTIISPAGSRQHYVTLVKPS